MKIQHLNKIWIFLLPLFMWACYNEEHFSLPGPYEEEEFGQLDSMPYPFAPGRTEGVYLIRNGQPELKYVSTLGYTDFAPHLGTDQLSWYQEKDRYGNLYFGSRPHMSFYPLSDADYLGGDRNSYQCNDLYGRLFLQTGPNKKWHLYAKMALETTNRNTFCNFILERKDQWALRLVGGFDNANNLFFFQDKELNFIDGSYKRCSQFYAPYETFEYEVICVNGFAYCKVNGLIVWAQNLKSETEGFPLAFRPWKNAVRFYDLYVEGDYEEMDIVSPQREKGYTAIQAPALVKSNNEILLFAEGRKYLAMQTSDLQAVRSNATDIILKRSSDGGETWSEPEILIGGDESVNLRPTVITDNEGKIHLFYTVDRNGMQDGNYATYTQVSEDGGHSWSIPVEIPCNFTGYTVSTQGGRGICRTDGTLVVPLQCSAGKTGTLATIVSSDNGQNWTPGTPLVGYRNRFANLIESLDGNTLTMYIGHDGSGDSRKISTSTDGLTWTDPVDANIDTGTSGQASSGATVQMQDGTLVHFTANDYVSGTDFATGYVSSLFGEAIKQQKEMYIYNSPDFSKGLDVTILHNGETKWTEPESMLKIQTYPYYKFLTGKADAIAIDEHTVLCVCEGGVAIPQEGLISFKKTL